MFLLVDGSDRFNQWLVMVSGFVRPFFFFKFHFFLKVVVHYPPRSRFEKGFSRTSLWNNWNNHSNQTRSNLFGRGEWMNGTWK